jgi:hypothetical protein
MSIRRTRLDRLTGADYRSAPCTWALISYHGLMLGD